MADVEPLEKGDCIPFYDTYGTLRAQVIPEADAAIALVLEEAARVAEYRCGASEWSAETNSGYECAAKEIAAAIRALKEKE